MLGKNVEIGEREWVVVAHGAWTWSHRRPLGDTFAEAWARMIVGVEVATRAIGEAMRPSLDRLAEALREFGRAAAAELDVD
jgi:hypothetical protein